ncbi:MAG TPA: hypothetical protein VFT87_01920 [Candidatus Saccharimonadales bacterium]|nr:hypothetical protein [Candidatus Saccharimonadales bacterium]
MNEQNRKLILVIVSVVGFLVVLGVGLYVTLQPPQADTPPVSPASNQPQDVPTDSPDTDSHVTAELYLTNLKFLASWFNETEYLYINNEVINFGQQNFLETPLFTIDETSFTQTAASTFGFMIRDTNNTKLFYVVATRTADQQISLTFYKT